MKSIKEVKAYYEYARISIGNKPFKVAVLKVKYDDDSCETILRSLINHKSLRMIGIEEFKSIELNEFKQISNMLEEKDQKIFKLYIKKYFQDALNINVFKAKSNLRLYIENKKCNFITKSKTLFGNLSTMYNTGVKNI